MSLAPFVPEHAPFTPEQRAWLNEFFSGMFVSMQSQAAHKFASFATTPNNPFLPDLATTPHAATATETEQRPEALVPDASEAPESIEPAVDDHDFPWHDPSLEMAERMALAEGRPLKRQLMAAMAQFDCGACGYVCQTYSEAIASGEDSCLDRCVPGGSETEHQLQKILDANRGLPVINQIKDGSRKASPASTLINSPLGTHSAPQASPQPGFDRKQPITGRFVFAKPLNARGSSKDTRHVAIRFDANAPAYRAGDALGIYPMNDPMIVSQILELLQIDGLESIRTLTGETKTLFGALVEDCCLKSVSDRLAERLGLTSLDRNSDLLDAIAQAPLGCIDSQELFGLLRPLQPRLYSISSSPKKYPNEIHLTVGRVQWTHGNRTRLGVASNMLATRLSPRESLRVFIHRPQAFHMPEDPNVPMIMVGPGTGIAPFVGFLQEREATGARGRNWLFFGDQHAATDFLYEEQIRTWHRSGVISRLETAFSRDQAAKVYVQDRLLEHGREVYQWLQAGAHFYVCGDAKSMAASVQLALQQIIATFGGMTFEAAGDHIKELQKQQRYQRDVY